MQSLLQCNDLSLFQISSGFTDAIDKAFDQYYFNNTDVQQGFNQMFEAVSLILFILKSV